MAHEFIPGSSDAIASKADSISLDLGFVSGGSVPPYSISDLDLTSSRNKIVIHPYKNFKFLRTKDILPPQSVFKNAAKERASKSSTGENTSHSVAIEGKSPQQRVPSPRLRDKEAKKVAQVKRIMGRIDKKPIEKRPPSPRVVTPIPRPAFQSPYLDEYAKCGCTKQGGHPCQRCQLMLLSDRRVQVEKCLSHNTDIFPKRFCTLVDLQCKKWNIPE